jgi:hypothetical protein
MAAGDITWFRYKRHDDREQEVSPEDMDLPGHHSHYSYLQEITEMMTKQNLLDQAKIAVGDRGLNYGKPEDNFMRIANHWEMFFANKGYKDVVVTPGDVAVLMALMKIARIEYQPDHQDSWVDLAGYAACGAEIESSRVAEDTWPDSVDDGA